MMRSAARINRCIDGWAVCERDLAVEKGKRFVPGWKMWAIGLGTAVTIGIVVGKAAK